MPLDTACLWNTISKKTLHNTSNNMDSHFRWKEECNTITQKFENKISDLRAEISRHKKRCEELTKLLRESKDKNVEVAHSL